MKRYCELGPNRASGNALPRFAAVRSPVRGASARMPTQREGGCCGRLPVSRVESARTADRFGGGGFNEFGLVRSSPQAKSGITRLSRDALEGATATERPSLTMS